MGKVEANSGMPDLAEKRLLAARSHRRKRRFGPRVSSFLDNTSFSSVLSPLQAETMRLALRWPSSHLAAQRAVGTVLKEEEQRAIARFQQGVAVRRRPIETARCVVISSTGEHPDQSKLLPETTVISSCDGASLPVTLPAASRAVFCHACRQICKLHPLEAVRTCACTACCFCSSCRIAPNHDCKTALSLASAVVRKLEQTEYWPFVSVFL